MSRSDAASGQMWLHHFDPLRDVVEVGYWLFVPARGRGVAIRSVQQRKYLRHGNDRVDATLFALLADDS